MINKNNNIHTYSIYFLIYAADFRLINKSFFSISFSFIYYISHAAHSNNHTCRYNLDENHEMLLVPYFVWKGKKIKENFIIKIIWYMKWNWNEFRSNFDASFDKLFPCFVNFFFFLLICSSRFTLIWLLWQRQWH